MANELTLFLDAMDSQNALEHHGVKGMHWGKWNEETRRRRLGLKRAKATAKKARAAANKASSSEKVKRNNDAGYIIAGLAGYAVSELWNKKKYGYSRTTQATLRNATAYGIRKNQGSGALKNRYKLYKFATGSRKDANSMLNRELEIEGSNQLHAAMTQPGNHGEIPRSLVKAYYRGDTLRVKEEARKYIGAYAKVMASELNKQ